MLTPSGCWSAWRASPRASASSSANGCHLGTTSLRTGKSLTWDPEKEIFTGEHAEEANRHLARKMRKPYDYSFVA